LVKELISVAFVLVEIKKQLEQTMLQARKFNLVGVYKGRQKTKHMEKAKQRSIMHGCI
jgi:hypothetical protein